MLDWHFTSNHPFQHQNTDGRDIPQIIFPTQIVAGPQENIQFPGMKLCIIIPSPLFSIVSNGPLY